MPGNLAKSSDGMHLIQTGVHIWRHSSIYAWMTSLAPLPIERTIYIWHTSPVSQYLEKQDSLPYLELSSCVSNLRVIAVTGAGSCTTILNRRARSTTLTCRCITLFIYVITPNLKGFSLRFLLCWPPVFRCGNSLTFLATSPCVPA